MIPESIDSTIASLSPAGFAVHWLHPRKKRPIGSWRTAPVATLATLRASWSEGNNVGVRLGEPSRTAAGYVHVLDVDIRIEELADEAWAALRALLPTVDLDALPSVVSGSGGESRHLYFVSGRPFSSKLLLTSEGKHRRETHDPETGEVKVVWSYDWEIELFGTGKQVVLPPSIHPDSGRPYVWERPFDTSLLDLGLGPTIAADTIEALGVANHETFAFEARPPLDFAPGQMERELDLVDVSELHYDDWVRLGQALHHQFGGSQAGFDLWLQHTKRSKKYTGAAQDREMRRIKWRSFGKYRGQPVTMATIRQWAQAARIADLRDAFDEEDEDDDYEDEDPGGDVGEDPVGNLGDGPLGRGGSSDHASPLTDPLAALGLGSAETAAPTSPRAVDDLSDFTGGAASNSGGTPASHPAAGDWISLLDLNEEGVIKPTLHNVELIVKNDPRLVGVPQLNEFTQETVQRTPPGSKAGRRRAGPKPTRQLAGRVWDVRDTQNGELWSDDRDFAIRSILEAPKSQGGYGIKVTDRDLKAAVVLAANENAFHPVREYLEGLTWDGEPRVERLYIDFVKAPDDAYHRSVARLMMVAAVTRIFEPGHKFDFATILEGLQGKRKSTFISVMGRRWFAELDGDFHDSKQMIELMQGAWIMEIPELTGFGRADVRAIKAFISRQKDRARLAYARRAGEFPRQCIFIGSTNDREYLKDDTGGRRFWPVECRLGADEEIDTDRLEEVVDHLWAEAVTLYREMRQAKPKGTLPLYLADEESRVIAARLQESRRVESPDDVLAGKIAEWLDRPVNDGGFEDDPSGAPAYRNETCTAQVWAECLGGDPRAFKTQEQAMVNRAMLRVPGWGTDGSQMRFKIYGKQRVFYRGGEVGKIERMGLDDLLTTSI